MITRIRTLEPKRTILGYVKIGEKGEERQRKGGQGTYQMPVKLDHFKVTTTERDKSGNYVEDTELMKALQAVQYGGTGSEKTPLRVIDITLFSDNIDDVIVSNLNFFRKVKNQDGTSRNARWCYGDGKIAYRLNRDNEYVEIECPERDCEFFQKRLCRPYGRFYFMINAKPMLGATYVFSTTSITTLAGIYSSLEEIKQHTGGHLAWLRLQLVMYQMTDNLPQGGTTKNWKVGVTFPGDPQAFLTHVKDIKLLTEELGTQAPVDLMAHRRNLQDEFNDQRSQDDIVQEFYPDVEAGEVETITVEAKEPEPINESDLQSKIVSNEEFFRDYIPSDQVQLEFKKLNQPIEVLKSWIAHAVGKMNKQDFDLLDKAMMNYIEKFKLKKQREGEEKQRIQKAIENKQRKAKQVNAEENIDEGLFDE